MRNFRAAIWGGGGVLNVHAEDVYFHAEQSYFYAAARHIFLHRTAVFLRRNIPLPWNSLIVSRRRVSFSSAEHELNRDLKRVFKLSRYLKRQRCDSTEHVCFSTEYVRISTEERHISTQKLDFYTEHARFCAEGVAHYFGRDTLLKVGFQTYIFCSKVPSKCMKCSFRDPNFKNFPVGRHVPGTP